MYRRALVRNLFSLLLLSLFVLKAGRTFSTLISGKASVAIKVYADTESEQEEKKDTEKLQKAHEYLGTDEKSMMWTAGKDFRIRINRCSYFYRIDHFSSVPSPPPDRTV